MGLGRLQLVKLGRLGNSWQMRDPAETDATVPTVQNILLLDSEGKRIAVKYFDENRYCS